MKRILTIAFACGTVLLLTAPAPNPHHPANMPGTFSYEALLARELQSLTERGLRVQLLGEVVEATDPVSGQTWHFSTEMLTPRQPTYLELPTLTVDLNTLDTSLYLSKYTYLNSIPVTGGWGYSLQSDDLDSNGRTEVYGLYTDQVDGGTRVYETLTDTSWSLRFEYPIVIGRVHNIADLNHNNLVDVLARNGDTLYVFQQNASNSLNQQHLFSFRQWFYDATGIPNELYDIDNDGNRELLYRGSEQDTSRPPPGNLNKTYVARYDSAINNLTPVWGRQLPPGCLGNNCTGSLAPGDFDGDGKGEFVTSSFGGNVYVVEHMQGDSFEVVWQDSLSVAARVAAGDVDGNGIEEFFVGGNQAESDGLVHLRAYAYERTGDNIYQPVFEFNLFPVGFFFVDLYQTVDMDNDGQKELLISFGGGVVIIKGTAQHTYELFYHRQVSSLHSMSGVDVNKDGVNELLISRFYNDGTGLFTHTEVYELDSLFTDADEPPADVPQTARILANYPNPFNSETTIRYEIPNRSLVELDIYDINGEQVISLVHIEQEAGMHVVRWNGTTARNETASSGIYFCILRSRSGVQVIKLLLMK